MLHFFGIFMQFLFDKNVALAETEKTLQVELGMDYLSLWKLIDGF